MKNELSKHKKKVIWSMYGALVFILVLLFTVLGLIIYLLITDIQLSSYRGKSLSIGIITSLLGVPLTAKFWALPAIQKYIEVFRVPKQLPKEKKMFSGYILMIGLCLTLFIAFGIFLGYSGCHRPSYQNDKLEKTDKIGVPLKPNIQPAKTPATTLQDFQEKDAIATPSVSDIENANMLSNKEQSDLKENTDPDKDKSVSQR